MRAPENTPEGAPKDALLDLNKNAQEGAFEVAHKVSVLRVAFE